MLAKRRGLLSRPCPQSETCLVMLACAFDMALMGQKKIATYTDSDIPDRVDDFQQQVDNIIDIDIGAMDVVTSAQDQPSAA
ncbi:hypothetical protein B0H14DRAFT_3497683 [Mycena olivaceomarginata]|nr:hypothetical protein B0H14DRAFT_3497683 [Mycena olivaceomarginata]